MEASWGPRGRGGPAAEWGPFGGTSGRFLTRHWRNRAKDYAKHSVREVSHGPARRAGAAGSRTPAAHHRPLPGSLSKWRAASKVVTRRVCQLSNGLWPIPSPPCLGCGSESSWTLLGVSSEGSRGPPRGSLGASWGPPGGFFGTSWGPLGGSWGPLGASWGLPGGLLGPSGSLLERKARNVRSGSPSGPLLGPSWGPLGPSQGPLGTVLGPSGAVLERREAKMARTSKSFKNN